MTACKTCNGRGKVQGGYAGETLEDCPCTPCGNCGGSGVVDSGGSTPWGAPIDLPCPACKSKWDDLVILGASWRKDSSLEKWFPFTAEELAALKQRHAELYRLVELYLTTPNTDPVIADHYDKLCVWFASNKRPDGSEPLPIAPTSLREFGNTEL